MLFPCKRPDHRRASICPGFQRGLEYLVKETQVCTSVLVTRTLHDCLQRAKMSHGSTTSVISLRPFCLVAGVTAEPCERSLFGHLIACDHKSLSEQVGTEARTYHATLGESRAGGGRHVTR